MENLFILIADLAGTVIFAVTGALSGVRQKLDLLGVVVFGCTVGVGGGVLRDTVIGATPVAALQNELYLILCIATGLIVFCISPLVTDHLRVIKICDAFGLGVFTALGAAKGAQFGLGPTGVVLCGVFSAVGGGLLRDVLSRKIPEILVNDFYAPASLIGGIVYLLLPKAHLSGFAVFVIVAVLVTLIRMAAMTFSFRLPRASEGVPQKNDPQD